MTMQHTVTPVSATHEFSINKPTRCTYIRDVLSTHTPKLGNKKTFKIYTKAAYNPVGNKVDLKISIKNKGTAIPHIRSPQADMKCEPYKYRNASLSLGSLPTQQVTKIDGILNIIPIMNIGIPAWVLYFSVGVGGGGGVILWFDAGIWWCLWLLVALFAKKCNVGGHVVVLPEKHKPPAIINVNDNKVVMVKIIFWRHDAVVDVVFLSVRTGDEIYDDDDIIICNRLSVLFCLIYS